ncbi:hypothetical protein MBANPS3_012551 [Mucor bainieri]
MLCATSATPTSRLVAGVITYHKRRQSTATAMPVLSDISEVELTQLMRKRFASASCWGVLNNGWQSKLIIGKKTARVAPYARASSTPSSFADSLPRDVHKEDAENRPLALRRP